MDMYLWVGNQKKPLKELYLSQDSNKVKEPSTRLSGRMTLWAETTINKMTPT